MPDQTDEHRRLLGTILLELDDEVFEHEAVPDPTAEATVALARDLAPDAAPELVERLHTEAANYGYAAGSVQAKIAADGGTIRHGWRLREWPEVLLTAEPHVLWIDPAGKPWDIVPALTNGIESVFVPALDNAEPGRGSLFRVLYAIPDRTAIIAERIAALKPGQLAYETRRAAKAGLSLTAWIETKLGGDPVAAGLAGLIAACKAYGRCMPKLPDMIDPKPDDWDDVAEGEYKPEYGLYDAETYLIDASILRLTAADAIRKALPQSWHDRWSDL